MGRKTTSPTKKDDPRDLGFIIFSSANFIHQRRILNTKARTTFKRRTTVRQTLTNYKHLALNETKKKPKVRQDLANITAVAMQNTIKPWFPLFHKNSEKKLNFSAESKLNMCAL